MFLNVAMYLGKDRMVRWISDIMFNDVFLSYLMALLSTCGLLCYLLEVWMSLVSLRMSGEAELFANAFCFMCFPFQIFGHRSI